MTEEIKCPECLEATSQEELDMFNGLCEECNLEWIEAYKIDQL